MSDLPIEPLTRPFSAVFTPPGSKSLTNRALVLAALAKGSSRLGNVLLADDTAVMLDGLKRLGFELDIDRSARTVTVAGRAGTIPAQSADIFCGNSGTTIRFLAALSALGKGEFRLDGIARMRQRPIGELAALLRDMGVRSRFEQAVGFPPIVIEADKLPGGIVKCGAAQSSQFLSAALMVSPYARHEVRFDLVEPQPSWPYVEMTMKLMDRFGVTPELIRDRDTGDPKQIIVPRHAYTAGDYAIEPDASNASYFLALAAIHPGAEISIEGLGHSSLQGDVGFAQVLRKMGADVQVEAQRIRVKGPGQLEGIDIDLGEMPDVAQTLAVVALFAEGQTILRGLGTLRVKETDRLAALSMELSRLGASVEVDGESLKILPPRRIQPAAIDTYDDHRMAMSFSLAGTRAAGIVIRNSACVNKTYPEYFTDLGRVVQSSS